MTQGPDDAVLRIALDVLRRDFGVDVSPAASLTGDALLEWVQAADKVLCEEGPPRCVQHQARISPLRSL